MDIGGTLHKAYSVAIKTRKIFNAAHTDGTSSDLIRYNKTISEILKSYSDSVKKNMGDTTVSLYQKDFNELKTLCNNIYTRLEELEESKIVKAIESMNIGDSKAQEENSKSSLQRLQELVCNRIRSEKATEKNIEKIKKILDTLRIFLCNAYIYIPPNDRDPGTIIYNLHGIEDSITVKTTRIPQDNTIFTPHAYERSVSVAPPSRKRKWNNDHELRREVNIDTKDKVTTISYITTGKMIKRTLTPITGALNLKNYEDNLSLVLELFTEIEKTRGNPELKAKRLKYQQIDDIKKTATLEKYSDKIMKTMKLLYGDQINVYLNNIRRRTPLNESTEFKDLKGQLTGVDRIDINTLNKLKRLESLDMEYRENERRITTRRFEYQLKTIQLHHKGQGSRRRSHHKGQDTRRRSLAEQFQKTPKPIITR